MKVVGLARRESATPKNDSMKSSDQRAELLRAISRLRSGIPPLERLADLTVGSQEVIPSLRSLLVPSDGKPRWLLICGNYGSGKSHMIAVFSELAVRENYAFCYLSADRGHNALNHPQRFVSTLLGTLEIPESTGGGYMELICSALTDSRITEKMIELSERYLDDSSRLGIDMRRALRDISLMQRGRRTDLQDEWSPLALLVANHLSGESIAYRQGMASYRKKAYHLLAFANQLLVHMGYRGLAIGIDEVESVFTKLPSSRSREGAIRTLCGLASLGFPIVMGITPDAFKMLRVETRLECCGGDTLPAEKNQTWRHSVISGNAPVLHCREMSRQYREELLEKLKGLYLSAYGAAHRTDLFDKAWTNHVDNIRLDIPLRILLRRAVDLLDAYRYSGINQSRLRS